MDLIMRKTGWGLYSNMLTSYGALCYLSNALAFMVLPLYLPMISCDISLSENTLVAVDFCLYIGMAVGGFLLSSVADATGRKTILALTQVVIFLSVLIIAFSYGPLALILASLVLGTGLEANLNIAKVLIIESLPREKCYYVLTLLDLFWSIGIISIMGLHWIMSPFILQYYSEHQRFLSWRVCIILSVLPTILMGCITSLVLDSPKYLIFERRPREAIDVIKEIYAINCNKLFTSLDVTEADLQGKISDFGISNEQDLPNTLSGRRFRIIFDRIHKSSIVIVRTQFLKHTVFAIIFRLILTMGHLPVALFLARTLDYQGDDSPTDKYLLWHFEHLILKNCNHFTHDLDLYADFMVLCVCSVFGCFILMMLLKWLERKFILASCLFLCGICCLLLAVLLGNYMIRFVISGMFVICYGIAGSCLDIIILDLFPTAVRGTAIGETMIFARLANVFVIKYLTVSIEWLFISFACLMVFGALLSFLLPKFGNKIIPD